ncbi:hypothetical protein E4T56_gene13139 [Termitomyces sp. T112]|nr:hypothetical protein E4T56_gene13139 [Termitomyces sp. T112]
MPPLIPDCSLRLEGLDAEGGNLPRHFVRPLQHFAPTPANSNAFLANSNGPLANSDIFPTAASASPGLPEPLGPLPRHA